MGTTPAPGDRNQSAVADPRLDSADRGRPRWTIGRLAEWLFGVIAPVAVLAVLGSFGWREHAAASNLGALRAAFPDIADRGWPCTDEAAADGSDGYLVSCLTG